MNANTITDQDENSKGIRSYSRYTLNLHRLTESNIVYKSSQSNYTSLNNENKILKKLDIVKYTLNSIKTEHEYAKQEEDFLPLCLSWLWIKGYYIVFHLLSLIISYEKKDDRYISNRRFNDHGRVLSLINEIINSSKPFTPTELNLQFSGEDLSKFKTTNHVNLRNVGKFDVDLYTLSLKKVYKEEVKLKLKGLRKNKRLEQLNKLNSKSYSVFNIFQYFRELFNYSGFRYLDCEDESYNELELKKFYYSSHSVIASISQSLIAFLLHNTSGQIKSKLLEIKN